DQGTTVGLNRLAKQLLGSDPSPGRGVVQVADELSTQHPEVVHMPANGSWGKPRGGQMLDEGPEADNQFFAGRQVLFPSHPRARPVLEIAAVDGSIGGRRRAGRAVYFASLRLENPGCH